jgi:type II secretory pathway pseudopilin PulG
MQPPVAHRRSGLLSSLVGLAIAAALLAAGLQGLQVYQSRQAFRATAHYYGQKEQELRTAIAQGREIGPSCRAARELQAHPSPARLTEMEQLAERYAALKRKYVIASSKPWKVMPPDASQP